MGSGASSAAASTPIVSQPVAGENESKIEKGSGGQSVVPSNTDVAQQDAPNGGLSQKEVCPRSDIEVDVEKDPVPTLSTQASEFILQQQARQFDHYDPTQHANVAIDEKNPPVIAPPQQIVPTTSVNIHDLQTKRDEEAFAKLWYL